MISIHALLAESDVSRSAYYSPPPNFYPRSPCGERPILHSSLRSSQLISIHALLAESDCNAHSSTSLIQHISIHALLAESDTSSVKVSVSGSTFLSTLSLRRATNGSAEEPNQACHFYPRSPCGERQEIDNGHETTLDISIHALLAESDLGRGEVVRRMSKFLSTLSLRRATSIGTLRTVSVRNFYPRSPCGERLGGMSDKLIGSVFLSTLSLRRATCRNGQSIKHRHISIHALLAESDIVMAVRLMFSL